jgi:hypothetical protein
MARDFFHYEVKEALIKDGWTITNDPLVLLSKTEGGIQTDLGAEKIITAQKGLTKIAVEVKSFIHPSIIHEFLEASGQYTGYLTAMRIKKSDRLLYLAIPGYVYEKLMLYEFIREMISEQKIKLILYNPTNAEVELWIE